jgi:hypothetical protein
MLKGVPRAFVPCSWRLTHVWWHSWWVLWLLPHQERWTIIWLLQVVLQLQEELDW